MTCSSVHISSWTRLWLLNFCHPPETICSSLYCWKEKMMEKKILSKFSKCSSWEMRAQRIYNLFNRNRRAALTKWPVWPADCWWHISSVRLRSMTCNRYLRGTFNRLGTVPDAWDPLVGKVYKNPALVRFIFYRLTIIVATSFKFSWQLKTKKEWPIGTPSPQKRPSEFSTQFPTYKITIKK